MALFRKQSRPQAQSGQVAATSNADRRQRAEQFLHEAEHLVPENPSQFRGSPIRLQSDERVFAAVSGVGIVDPNRPVGRDGRPTMDDVGEAMITDRRVVFAGIRTSREWRLDQIIQIDRKVLAPGAAVLNIGVRNREGLLGLAGDPESIELTEFRLRLALAHRDGNVDAFIEDLQGDLRNLPAGSCPSVRGHQRSQAIDVYVSRRRNIAAAKKL